MLSYIMMIMHVIIVLVLLIAGLSLGSFINAYTWRIYKQSKLKKKDKSLSIVYGHSMCPTCKHSLATKDLMPILSWVSLRGNCRYCGKPISYQYPLVEALTAIAYIFSYIYWPLNFNALGTTLFIIWLLTLVVLISLVIFDLKHFLLPNRMLTALLTLVGIQVVIGLFYFHPLSYITGCLIGFLIGGGAFYILFQVSGGKWIGGGDVKLGAILGLMLGSGLLSMLMIFLSSLMGTLVFLTLISLNKLNRRSMIPYGPFLIIAAIVLQLFGQSIVNCARNKGFVI